jgi:phosphate transport system substrate-binding protein
MTQTAFNKALAMAASALAVGISTAGAQVVIKVDESLPVYSVTEGISGNLSSVGSDTLNNLMTFWAEDFKKHYPNVNIQIEGKGSSTAPPALIGGLSQLGPMSRAMKPSEIDDFEKEFGYKPTGIKVAVDALAIFVNKDNPMECLSIEQADAIFSKSRRHGFEKDITTWGELGLTGDWADRPISLYGRNSASGTYGFFKEHTLKNGDFKDTVKEQPGSASVVQGITVDRFGIGYSGIGYTTPGVRALPLSMKAGTECFEATQDNAYSGKYPLSRFLYVYVNNPPGEEMDPLTREFLKLVLSKAGQEICVKDGYFPLPAKIVDEELKKLK